MLVLVLSHHSKRILVLAFIFLLFPFVLGAETAGRLAKNRMDILGLTVRTEMKKFPKVENYDSLSLSTRAFHLGWEELPNDTLVKEGDLLYHAAPYIKPPYNKLFFFYDKAKSKFSISEFGNGSAVFRRAYELYGYSISGFKDILESSNSIKYLEFRGELNLRIAKMIVEKYPKLSIINLREDVSVEAMKFLLDSLEIEYCSFIDYNRRTYSKKQRSSQFIKIRNHPIFVNNGITLLLQAEPTLRFFENCFGVLAMETEENSNFCKNLVGYADHMFSEVNKSLEEILGSSSLECLILNAWPCHQVFSKDIRRLERLLSASNLRSLFISGSCGNAEYNDPSIEDLDKWRRDCKYPPFSIHDKGNYFDLSILPISIEFFGMEQYFTTLTKLYLPRLKYLSTNYSFGHLYGRSTEFAGTNRYPDCYYDIFNCQHPIDLSVFAKLEYVYLKTLHKDTAITGFPPSLRFLRISFVVDCFEEFLASISPLNNLESLHIRTLCLSSLKISNQNNSKSVQKLALHETRYLKDGKADNKLQFGKISVLKRVLSHLLPSHCLEELDITGVVDSLPDNDFLNSLKVRNLIFLNPKVSVNSRRLKLIGYPVLSRKVDIDSPKLHRLFVRMLAKYKEGYSIERFFLRKLVGK